MSYCANNATQYPENTIIKYISDETALQFDCIIFSNKFKRKILWKQEHIKQTNDNIRFGSFESVYRQEYNVAK